MAANRSPLPPGTEGHRDQDGTVIGSRHGLPGLSPIRPRGLPPLDGITDDHLHRPTPDRFSPKLGDVKRGDRGVVSRGPLEQLSECSKHVSSQFI
jgi:hypothetical protein